MAIDTIAWDIGGVWVNDAMDFIHKNFEKTEGRRRLFRQLLRGQVSEHAFWDGYVIGSNWEGRTEECTREFYKAAESSIEINAPLLVLHDRLSARGIKHGIVTNNCREWTTFVLNHIERKFYPVVISSAHSVGVLKPDAAIFLKFLKEAGKQAEQVLLVDDKQKNIEGAKAVGMHGIVFRTVEQVEKDLSELLAVK